MANHLLVGLDIGTARIKCLVARPSEENEDLEILSLVSEPSFGIRRGVVVDPEKVSESISSVLSKAEKEIGQKIKEVAVNFSGAHLFTTESRGTIAVSRADQTISQEDIERVIEAAQTFSLPSNREILDVFPKEFIVDGEKEIKEPLGMQGIRLESEILVLGCFSPYLKNLTKAVLEADVQIVDVVASPLASAQALLKPREKELGVLLVDIGAGTTSFVIFLEGSLVNVGVIPIGSGHITNDIAIGLKTDVETAERIKLQYGACLISREKKIKIKEKISGEPLVFSSKLLGRIIDARVAEILEQIQRELKKAKLTKLPGGVVLAGGGIRLPRCRDYAKKILRLPVRLGRPLGFSPVQEEPDLACVCGLVLVAAESAGERPPRGSGLLKRIKTILKSFIP